MIYAVIYLFSLLFFWITYLRDKRRTIIIISTTDLMKKFLLAICQTRCVPNKAENIMLISTALREAGQKGANVSILGETCNAPYVKSYLH